MHYYNWNWVILIRSSFNVITKKTIITSSTSNHLGGYCHQKSTFKLKNWIYLLLVAGFLGSSKITHVPSKLVELILVIMQCKLEPKICAHQLFRDVEWWLLGNSTEVYNTIGDGKGKGSLLWQCSFKVLNYII